MERWRKELYLAHHGIKGQQWGVRRGPPYPLDASIHSRSKSVKSVNKPAGKLADSGENGRKAKFHLTGKQKLAILGTVSVVGIAALSMSVKDKRIANALLDGRQYANAALTKVGHDAVSTVSPFKMKKNSGPRTDESIIEDVTNTNPKRGNRNCVACAMAYCMRAKGYDVAAKIATDEGKPAFDIKLVERAFGSKMESLNSPHSDIKEAYDDLLERLLSYGEGSVGICRGRYTDEIKEKYIANHPDRKTDYANGVGHVLAWEIHNGKVLILDGQSRQATRSDPSKADHYTSLYKTAIHDFDPSSISFMPLESIVDFAVAKLVVEDYQG